MAITSTNSKLKDRVVHTSLAGFVSEAVLTTRETFPQDRPSIGVIVRVGYQYRLKRILADVCCHTPTILATQKGEYIELEEVDSKVRESLVSLSQHCRQMAEELVLHAERLEEIACNEEIIDDLSKFIEMRDSGTDPDQIGAEMVALRSREAESVTAKSYISTEHEFVVAGSHREPRNRKQQPQERISKPGRPKAEIDIDALLEDEEED